MLRTRGGHSFNDFGGDGDPRRKLVEAISLYRIPVPEGGIYVGQIQGELVSPIAQEAQDLRQNLDYMHKQFVVIEEARAAGEIQTELLALWPCLAHPGRQAELLGRWLWWRQSHLHVSLDRFGFHGLDSCPLDLMLVRWGRSYKRGVYRGPS